MSRLFPTLPLFFTTLCSLLTIYLTSSPIWLLFASSPPLLLVFFATHTTLSILPSILSFHNSILSFQTFIPYFHSCGLRAQERNRGKAAIYIFHVHDFAPRRSCVFQAIGRRGVPRFGSEQAVVAPEFVVNVIYLLFIQKIQNQHDSVIYTTKQRNSKTTNAHSFHSNDHIKFHSDAHTKFHRRPCFG